MVNRTGSKFNTNKRVSKKIQYHATDNYWKKDIPVENQEEEEDKYEQIDKNERKKGISY